MSITNLTILDTTTYGVPSGNYDGSSLAFVSDAEKAVNYYQGQGSIQTVTIRVQDFPGIITLQATLDENPASVAWFDVYTYGDGSSPMTDHHPVALTGNFAWMRAAVTDFSAGTIEYIKIAY